MVVNNKKKVSLPKSLIVSGVTKEVNIFKYLDLHNNTRRKNSIQIKTTQSKITEQCGVSLRLGELLNIQTPEGTCNSCIYFVIFDCIRVRAGVSQCMHISI